MVGRISTNCVVGLSVRPESKTHTHQTTTDELSVDTHDAKSEIGLRTDATNCRHVVIRTLSLRNVFFR